jgi:hypothetical protein
MWDIGWECWVWEEPRLVCRYCTSSGMHVLTACSLWSVCIAPFSLAPTRLAIVMLSFDRPTNLSCQTTQSFPNLTLEPRYLLTRSPSACVHTASPIIHLLKSIQPYKIHSKRVRNFRSMGSNQLLVHRHSWTGRGEFIVPPGGRLLTQYHTVGPLCRQ